MRDEIILNKKLKSEITRGRFFPLFKNSELTVRYKLKYIRSAGSRSTRQVNVGKHALICILCQEELRTVHL